MAVQLVQALLGIFRSTLRTGRWRGAILADALATAICASIFAAPAMAQSIPPSDSAGHSSWFSCTASGGNCTDVLVRAIRLANNSIMVETADLGPRSVVHALCSDMRRGIDVEVVQDSSGCEPHGSDTGQRLPAVRCDPNYQVDSPQTVVIDGKTVVRSFLGSTPRYAAPRPIEHLWLTMDRISALAYSDTWRGRLHPLQARACGLPE